MEFVITKRTSPARQRILETADRLFYQDGYPTPDTHPG